MSSASAAATVSKTGETVTATIVKYPEWQAMANTIMMACLIIFFILAISFALLKRQNVPITQAIEVDSREPHSITITFIPAQVMDKPRPDALSDNPAPISESENAPPAVPAEAQPPAAPTA